MKKYNLVRTQTNRTQIKILLVCFFFMSMLMAQEKPNNYKSTVIEKTAYEKLKQAQSLESDFQAIQILQENIQKADYLVPWYLLELILRNAATGNWKQALFWAEQQNLAALPLEISDTYIWWFSTSLLQNGKEIQAVELLYSYIKTGHCSDPLVYLLYFKQASNNTVEILQKFDQSFPHIKYMDTETYILSRYLAGLSAIREGNWSLVLDLYTQFSEKYKNEYPNYASWADYYLAYSNYRLGNFKKAIELFELFFITWPYHNFSWQAAMTCATALLQTKQNALPMTDRAIDYAPDIETRAETILFKSSILMDTQEYEKAEQNLIGIANGSTTNGRTKSSARAYFMLGEIRSRIQDYEKAEEYWLLLASLYTKDSLSEEAIFRIGEMWYIAGNIPKALRYFTQYRQTWLNGNFLSSVLRNGGDAYSKTGAVDLAILWWEELIRKFPTSSSVPRAYYELIQSYKKKHEYEAAIWTAEKYLTEFSREAQIDDIESEIILLKKYKDGENPDSFSLYIDWTRAKKAETASGRALGIRLAREYLVDYSTKEKAEPVLLEIINNMPSSIERLSGPEINTYAHAWNLLGNIHREKNNFKQASEELLIAGTLFAHTDGEKAAEALYATVDCFLQERMIADARSVLETMETTWEDSIWTRRAVLLVNESTKN